MNYGVYLNCSEGAARTEAVCTNLTTVIIIVSQGLAPSSSNSIRTPSSPMSRSSLWPASEMQPLRAREDPMTHEAGEKEGREK